MQIQMRNTSKILSLSLLTGLMVTAIVGCDGGGGGGGAPAPRPLAPINPTACTANCVNGVSQPSQQALSSTPVFQLSGTLNIPYSHLNANPRFSKQLDQMNDKLGTSLQVTDVAIQSGHVLTMQDVIRSGNPATLLQSSCLFRVDSCIADGSCDGGDDDAGDDGDMAGDDDGGGPSRRPSRRYQDISIAVNSQVEAYPAWWGSAQNSYVPTTVLIRFDGTFASQPNIEFFSCFSNLPYSAISGLSQGSAQSIPAAGPTIVANLSGLLSITPVSIPNSNPTGTATNPNGGLNPINGLGPNGSNPGFSPTVPGGGISNVQPIGSGTPNYQGGVYNQPYRN